MLTQEQASKIAEAADTVELAASKATGWWDRFAEDRTPENLADAMKMHLELSEAHRIYHSTLRDALLHGGEE